MDNFPGCGLTNSQPLVSPWCPNVGLTHREAWEPRDLRELRLVPGHRDHDSLNNIQLLETTHYLWFLRFSIYLRLSHLDCYWGLIAIVAVRRRNVYHRKLSVRPRTRVLFVKMICDFAKFIPRLVIRRTFAIQFLPELISTWRLSHLAYIFLHLKRW